MKGTEVAKHLNSIMIFSNGTCNKRRKDRRGDYSV